MFEAIRNAFLRTGSIDRTVEETGINEYKVRRVLLTLGLWESERSREVKALLDQGLSKEEVAETLSLSMKGLESYMPYTRGAYLEKDTPDSVHSKKYRQGKESALKRQVKRSTSKISDGGNVIMKDSKAIKVYKVKLSLEVDEEDLEALREFAGVKEGIIRTVLIPSSMQLHRLNYAIQKCFGFQNSHLHHFCLYDDDFLRLTGNDLEKWKPLAGKVFRCFFTDGDTDDYYYLDDYDGVHSFNSWLKRKYSRPYDYEPFCESMEVIEGELPYVKKEERYDDLRVSLTECGGDELLERLSIEDVFKISHEFRYRYDYGDNWKVRIKLLEEYGDSDLAQPEAVKKVKETLAPTCIYAEGLPLIEDVGGVSGFCDFLKGMHGTRNNRDYVKEDIVWAKSLGWSGRLAKAEKLL